MAPASTRHSAKSWTETRCGEADLLSWRSPPGRGPLVTLLRRKRILGTSPVRNSAQFAQKPRYGTGHLSDVLKNTILVGCLLVQADRGREPRPLEGGHRWGVGSQ